MVSPCVFKSALPSRWNFECDHDDNYDNHTQVTALVKMLIDEGQNPVMVCSAMGKTTNNLLNAGEFALKDGKVGPASMLLKDTHGVKLHGAGRAPAVTAETQQLYL